MDKKGIGVWVITCWAAAAIFFWVSGPLAIVYASEEERAIQYEVCPSAKIEKVTYFLQKTKSGEELCFFVTLKNLSQEPKRFRLRVSVGEGNTAGYLFPREGKEGKPAVMQPGTSLTNDDPLPIPFYSQLPGQISFMVEEI